MPNQFLKFKSLHEGVEPLLIANVWNVQSAKVFEKLNYKAIATSSAAVAETLGYADGQQMSFEEYLFVVKHIAKSTSLPFSVDLEYGFGNNAWEIAENIRELVKHGVSGMNIEDSTFIGGKRAISDTAVFAPLIKEVCQILKEEKIEAFVNLRCDTFLLGLPSAVEESLRRIKLYEETGVHGLFFPCITKESDIKTITSATTLPINVMCMPDLPDFKKLQDLGVKRISVGNFLNKNIYQQLEKAGGVVLQEGSFKSLFK